MSTPLDAFWYTRCAVPNSFGVAMSNGWIEQRFSAHGVPLRSIKEADDLRIRESHFDHSQPNSVRYGGSSPALWARSIGSKTRLLGLSATNESQIIVVRPDSDIASVAALKGRRFGLPKWHNQKIDFARAQSLRGLEAALSAEGLKPADVEIIDYPIGATFASQPVHRLPGSEIFGPRTLAGQNAEIVGLLKGEVEAIYLHGAKGLQIAHDFGLKIVTDLSRHADPVVRANNASPITLAVDQGFLDRAPELAAGLVREILRAEDWGAAHPDEVRRIAAGEVNVSEYWLSKAYGGAAGLRLRTSLAPDLVAGLKSFASFLHANGFLPQPVDIDAWLDPVPLASAVERAA